MSYKRDVFHSFNKGTMFSLGGEVSLPFGNKTLGLGGGGTVFEPFVAVAQLLPSAGFIQFQGGFELPAVAVELMFQPVGYRWAENLRTFEAAEVKRFNSYYALHGRSLSSYGGPRICAGRELEAADYADYTDQSV